MPAPVAVYIVVGVVGAAAVSLAFKEFVYEPHLAGKFEELKYKVRAYYWKRRAAREQARAQPFHSDDGGNDELDGGRAQGETDVEMKGLLFDYERSSSSSYDFSEVKGANDGVATTGALFSSSPPKVKTTATDVQSDLLQRGDGQQIRQRNLPHSSVDELLDLKENTSPVIVDLLTPLDTTSTVVNPFNHFLDQNSLPLNIGVEPGFIPKSHGISSPPVSPSSKTYSHSVGSPVLVSPFTSPRLQADSLPRVPLPSHDDSNPWKVAVPREAASSLSLSEQDMTSSMSNWEETSSQPVGSDRGASDTSDPELDFSIVGGIHSSQVAATSSEPAWSSYEDGNDNTSEASFSSSTTTSSSSIGSDIEQEHAVGRALNPSSSGSPGLGVNINNSISDSEWERFSDVEQ